MKPSLRIALLAISVLSVTLVHSLPTEGLVPSKLYESAAKPPLSVGSGSPALYVKLVKADSQAQSTGLMKTAISVMKKAGIKKIISNPVFAVGRSDNSRVMIRIIGQDVSDQEGDTWIIAAAGDDAHPLHNHLANGLTNPNSVTPFISTTNLPPPLPSVWIDTLKTDCAKPKSDLLNGGYGAMSDIGLTNLYSGSGQGGFVSGRSPNGHFAIVVARYEGCGAKVGNRWVLVGGGDDAKSTLKKLQDKLASGKWL